MNRHATEQTTDGKRTWLFDVALAALCLTGLYVASLQNYLLFHSLAEGFSIVVASGVFMLAWNARRFLENRRLLFIGVAYLFVASIDLVHMLGYAGTGVFPDYGTNLATQLWIGARYMEALALLAASLAFTVRMRPWGIMAVFATATILLIASIFSGVFPVCFAEGSGLTVFKVASEYVISAILVAAGVMLYRKKAEFDRDVLRLLMVSIALTVASEMAFTLYADPYGFFNLLGHFLKLLSFYLIYKAVIATGLTRPYDVLYRRISRSEERFRIVADFAYDWEYWLGTDKRFVYVSPSCERITGYASDAFMKDPDLFLRIIHEDDRARIAEHIVSTCESSDSEFLQFRIRDRQGNERWIEHICSPVFGQAGDYLGKRASNRDATDRILLEQRIESLSRFPSENPNPVLRIAADGAVKYANDAAIPVLEAWETGMEKKAPRAWRERIADAINAATPRVHEAAVGNDIYSFCIAPFTEQGYANVYGNCITEVKELHKREKLDAAARTELDTVEAMREGVALIGMDGVVRSVNPALTTLTGYGRDQLEGSPLGA